MTNERPYREAEAHRHHPSMTPAQIAESKALMARNLHALGFPGWADRARLGDAYEGPDPNVVATT